MKKYFITLIFMPGMLFATHLESDRFQVLETNYDLYEDKIIVAIEDTNYKQLYLFSVESNEIFSDYDRFYYRGKNDLITDDIMDFIIWHIPIRSESLEE